ncbi:MAG TPA: SymE family type I addiction module toxin [Parafilimonas sp.]|nr:SymE family type I addiction module toxin [Parafilimonas sp.]
MKQINSIAPTEQQSLEALEQLRDALTNMGHLRQNLTNLRDNGFTLLPENRRLKIQPVLREKQSDPFHIVPSLQLCGDWLKQAGFEHNQYVRIITLDQLLIICPELTLPRPGKLRSV